MSYNFKSIADVEVVAEPAESANVLIEENGVVKKAPKTAVGGGGEWDAVIEISSDISNLREITVNMLTLISGGYNEIAAKATAGEQPKILFKWKWWYSDYSYSEFWTATSVRFCAENSTLELSSWYNYRYTCATFYVALNSSNTFTDVNYSQW